MCPVSRSWFLIGRGLQLTRLQLFRKDMGSGKKVGRRRDRDGCHPWRYGQTPLPQCVGGHGRRPWTPCGCAGTRGRTPRRGPSTPPSGGPSTASRRPTGERTSAVSRVAPTRARPSLPSRPLSSRCRSRRPRPVGPGPGPSTQTGCTPARRRLQRVVEMPLSPYLGPPAVTPQSGPGTLLPPVGVPV